MFEMKEEYKTGIDFIDEQHTQLFNIGNRLVTLIKNDFKLDKYDEILEIIDELKEYTIFHFNAEEEYMASINFKGLEHQKQEHSAFIKKFDDIDLNSMDDNQDKYMLDLLNFINDWLINHILKKDKAIKS